MTQAMQSQINSIVSQLVTHYKPEKIILFGSAARGDSTVDSDLDLFIVKSGVEKLGGPDRYREVAKFLPSETAVDALVYTPYEMRKRVYLKDPFIETILKEGVELYAA